MDSLHLSSFFESSLTYVQLHASSPVVLSRCVSLIFHELVCVSSVHVSLLVFSLLLLLVSYPVQSCVSPEPSRTNVLSFFFCQSVLRVPKAVSPFVQSFRIFFDTHEVHVVSSPPLVFCLLSLQMNHTFVSCYNVSSSFFCTLFFGTRQRDTETERESGILPY